MCASVLPMQRVETILVILALLATPMALLARSDCRESACDCSCDLVNRTLLTRAHHGRTLCGEQITGSTHQCAMNRKHQIPDYGFNTMMAPTAPLPMAGLPTSVRAVEVALPRVASPSSGFLSAPFEPPRT